MIRRAGKLQPYDDAKVDMRIARFRQWSLLRVVAAMVAFAPSGSLAQDVLLALRPHEGDTLRTHYEQKTEMRGTTRRNQADTTMVVLTSLTMFSRVIVDESGDAGSTVTAITDSVAIVSPYAPGGAAAEAIGRALRGSRVRVRFSPQGSATVLEGRGDLPDAIRSLASQMPAMLPLHAVAIGGSWSQSFTIPDLGQTGHGPALVRAVYRLDSLSRGGALAFISFRGSVHRDSVAAGPAAGSGALPPSRRFESSGSITGTLRLDRKRGWWLDSRAAIVLRSTIAPRDPRQGEPVRMQTTITQHMWTQQR